MASDPGQPPFELPTAELVTRVSRSSGAGGQHVNKTASRVEISWNVRESRAITPEQRERLLQRLASRLSVDGSVRAVASDTRSQLQNRELAEARLTELVRRALVVPKKRKPTRPTRGSREARLEAKKRHSRKKTLRRGGHEE